MCERDEVEVGSLGDMGKQICIGALVEIPLVEANLLGGEE